MSRTFLSSFCDSISLYPTVPSQTVCHLSLAIFVREAFSSDIAITYSSPNYVLTLADSMPWKPLYLLNTPDGALLLTTAR